MKKILRSGWDALLSLLATPVGLVVIVAYLAWVAWLLNSNPISLLYRLMLLMGLMFIYLIPQKKIVKVILGAIVALLIVPFFGIRNPFLLELGFQIAVFSALALGLNIVVGFAGLLDLGYIAFFAVGAYLWGFFGSQQMWNLWNAPNSGVIFSGFPLPEWTFWGFVALGTLAAAGSGILLGLPVLRLRGDYLAIVTLGFGEVIRVLANNLSKPINLTGGPQGIQKIQKPFEVSTEFAEWLSGFTRSVQGVSISPGGVYPFFFYLLSIAILVILIITASRLENSKLGRSWTAIREDDVAAIAMGVPLRRTKLTAFAIGAAFAGGMGVVYAAHRSAITPETFALTESIGVLVMVILGGLGSIPGVIVGATIVQVLEIDLLQSLSLMLSSLRQNATAMIPLLGIPWSSVPVQLDPARYQRLVFGLLLIIMMIFRPEGIIPSRRAQLELHEDDEDEAHPGNPQADLPDAALEHGTTGMEVKP